MKLVMLKSEFEMTAGFRGAKKIFVQVVERFRFVGATLVGRPLYSGDGQLVQALLTGRSTSSGVCPDIKD